MFEIIFKYLDENLNSSVFALLLLSAAIMWLIYKCTKFFTEWESKKDQYSNMEKEIKDIHKNIANLGGIKEQHNHMEKEIKDIHKDIANLGGIKEQHNHMEKEIKGMHKDIANLGGEVKSIGTTLDTVLRRIESAFPIASDHTPMKSSSPLALTDVGKAIADAIGAESIVEKHGDVLSAIIEEKQPSNSYDMQQACFKTVDAKLEDMLTKDQVNACKEQAFIYDILVIDVYRIVGLMLRDKLIAKHGWKVSGINTHDLDKNSQQTESTP